MLTFYADADSDTYGDAGSTTAACSAPAGYVSDNTDCNDASASINPAATEICNAIDDDCDGTADDGLTFTTYYADADSDGYGNAAVTTTSCAGIPAGYVADNTDCDDTNAAINPTAVWYLDADGDLYYTGTGVTGCASPGAGYAYSGMIAGGDCNDGSATVNPGAAEICGNGTDDDCDGTIDDGCTVYTFFADADIDGYGNAAVSVTNFTGIAPTGYVSNTDDCDDSNAAVNPAATEICNAIDDDCDGSVDEGLVFTTYYADADSDGFGDALITTASCAGTPAGYVADNTDCDDTQSTVYPGATEICDGLDNDCDGDFDEGTVTATITPSGTVTTCRGVPYILTANAGPGFTYQWFKNGNVITGATNITYGASKPGYYQVQVNAPLGCFDLSLQTTVQVNPSPNANISAPNGTSLCTTVRLKASYDATYTWQWLNGGVPIPGAINYLFFPTGPGNYSCSVTNAFGCSRTTAVITVTACKESEETTAAVQETFELYPNPAENEFMLDMELNTTEQSAQVVILNMVGAQIYAGTLGIDQGSIYQSIFLDDSTPSGMYIVKVLVAEREYTKQLVIQK